MLNSHHRALAIGLAAGRLAIGAGLWLAPARSSRALGFEPLDGGSLALARLAATRDIALGAWQLAVLDDREALRRATGTIAAVDAGDALSFALALGAPESRTAGVRGLPVALAASLAGAWLGRNL